jgi:putative oligomerization/nucleic acid binding protein
MFMRRRRPLMRAAVVGGVAYHAGKKVQEGRYEDDATQARLDQLEQQQYQQQAAAAAAPPAGGMSDATIQQLKQLGELKAQGILTDEEFEEQKRKLLAGA